MAGEIPGAEESYHGGQLPHTLLVISGIPATETTRQDGAHGNYQKHQG